MAARLVIGLFAVQPSIFIAVSGVHADFSGGPACSFLGGLLTADVSAKCCFTTQVITQRALEHYGMAQRCKPAWDCEADGLTPKTSFQRMALRDMCAEPACLPRVLEAMNSSWMTSRGVPQYSHVCESPAAMGVTAPMHNNLARRHSAAGGALRLGRARRRSKDEEEEYPDVGDNPTWEVCLREVCDNQPDSPNQFVTMCDNLREVSHSCYEHCCQSDDSVLEPTTLFDGDGKCLPGEALADVQGIGPVPVGQLRVGDRVLGRVGGGFGYEPVLAFLHASRPSSSSANTARFAVAEILHERGVLRASPGHLVFTAGGSVDVPAALLRPGEDELLAADGSSTRVLAVRKSGAFANDGLHAPLTASGTIVVDGVLASIYAWPSLQRKLPHRLAHASLLPVRLYHSLQMPAVLAPFFGRFCRAKGEAQGVPRTWLCRGGGLARGAGSASSEEREVGEELHPWLELLHGQLGLWRALPAP